MLPAGVPGITLHTSEDGGAHFKAACLPVALRVNCSYAVLHHDTHLLVCLIQGLQLLPASLHGCLQYVGTAGLRRSVPSLQEG